MPGDPGRAASWGQGTAAAAAPAFGPSVGREEGMWGGYTPQPVPLQQCRAQGPLGRAAPKPGGALDRNIWGVTWERLLPPCPALATLLQLQPHSRGVPPAVEPPAMDPSFLPISMGQGPPPQAQGPRFPPPYRAGPPPRPVPAHHRAGPPAAGSPFPR